MARDDNEMIGSFEQTEVPIDTDEGKVNVPALTHELCPGLAVTMGVFGLFTVTHINTGMKMCGSFGRSATAGLIMTKYQLIAKKFGFSWPEYTPDILLPHMESEVPFKGSTVTNKDGTRNMTVKEWMQHIRCMATFDEFPWEEKHPLDTVAENLEALAP